LTSPSSGVTAPAIIFSSVGLAGAVAAHDAPALAAADRQVDAVVDGPAAVALVTPSSVATWSPERGGVRKSNFTTRRFFGSSIFSIFSSALTRLWTCAALAACAAKRLDEPLFLGQHRLLPRVSGLAVGLANRRARARRSRSCRVGGDLAAVDLGDLSCTEAVHEFAVVRGHEQRAGSVLRNSSSQMIDSMSRWLVGSSISRHVGPPSSTRAIATRIFQPPDSSPTSPSMRVVLEPETVQHFARLRLERVAAEVLVLSCTSPKRGEDLVQVAGAVGIAIA
jgi:hypothetical protein